MKSITNKKITEDLEIISKMFTTYNEAIWEGQTGNYAHFDNQQKVVRLCMSDLRCGLMLAQQALMRLHEAQVTEDEG